MISLKKILLPLTLLCAGSLAFAQGRIQEKIDTVKLWPQGAPDAFEIPSPESGFIVFQAQRYSEALMEVYPAKQPNGICVIMCPGGAYILESQTYEGRDLKDWFNARGITYCMLQYRLPVGHSEVPLNDVKRAISIMRERADELGIKSVGIMGNSAGGHLAACAATLYDSPETRPDFQILMYPVITMEEALTNGLSRDALLGKNPSEDLVNRFSCEKNVTPDTPPAFIVLCADDPDVNPANSFMYCSALIEAGVEVSMHMYPKGGHGWGWKDSMPYKDDWVAELKTWLTGIEKQL